MREDNRYGQYVSKEALEDTMHWGGYTKEEIKKTLDNFIPGFYDRLTKTWISLEECNERVEKTKKTT